MNGGTHTLILHPGRHAVVRLPPSGPTPRWARGGAGFLSVTRTTDELSILTAEDRVPPGVAADRGWRLVEVAGPFPLDAVGVLAALAAPLAAAGISLLAVSTHDTDFFLIPGRRWRAALAAWRAAGHRIRRRGRAVPSETAGKVPRRLAQ